jgi:NDMA-dependent alcohol dehydrogenase
MKTRAAILTNAPGSYKVDELDLDDPRQGEICVRMAAAGLCHTDYHLATGDMPYGHYPVVGGHEGAGVVVGVGPNTPGWAEGDHVVFSFLPVCGRCRWCATGHQVLCDRGQHLMTGARPDDPASFRLSRAGSPVGQLFGLSTFSDYTTVGVDQAIKLPPTVPLDAMCLLGCGVGTGWGSAVNAAAIRPGDVIIVMGVGGIGMNALQGARHAGAAHILAVDPVPFKRDKAPEFGATDTFADMAAATDYARSLTNGQGADSAIVTVGVTTPSHVGEAFQAIRKAGTVVVTGMGDMRGSEALPVNLAELTTMEKKLVGSLFGSSNPTADILNSSSSTPLATSSSTS